MHGIWQWCIILLSPFIAIVYMALYAVCGCKEDRTDKAAQYSIMPFILFVCVVIVLGCIGFIVLFVGNMTYWNDDTFVTMDGMDFNVEYDDDQMMVFQIVIAFGLIIFLVPMFACSLLLIAGCLDRERELPNGMDSLKRSITKLPGVGMKKQTKKKTKKGSDYNTVPMSAYPDPNYDVYN